MDAHDKPPDSPIRGRALHGRCFGGDGDLLADHEWLSLGHGLWLD
jgi:hypothetical protein